MARQPESVFLFNSLMAEYNFMKSKDGYRRILQTVLCNMDAVTHMRLDEAATFCNVSLSTFLRFLKAFHFTSFSEFKYRLIEERTRYRSKYPMASQARGEDLLGALVDSTVNAMEDCKKSFDADALDRLVDMMHESKKVFFFDIRYSQGRISLQNNLAFSGIRVYFSADALDQFEYLTEADEHSIILVNAHRAEQDQYLHKLLPEIQHTKAVCAALLPCPDSSIERYCQHVVYFGTQQVPGFGNGMANDILYVYLSERYAQKYL